MDYQNILSNEFRELDLIAKKQKENYISAYPFPHITVRNFFSNDFLNQVLDEFPDLSKLYTTHNYNNQNEEFASVASLALFDYFLYGFNFFFSNFIH